MVRAIYRRGISEERLVKMKITVNVDWNIDCTPDEARAFFGLPDLKPMQEELFKGVQERLRWNLQAMAPEAMLTTWLPASLRGFERLQEVFVSQMWLPHWGSRWEGTGSEKR